MDYKGLGFRVWGKLRAVQAAAFADSSSAYKEGPRVTEFYLLVVSSKSYNYNFLDS